MSRWCERGAWVVFFCGLWPVLVSTSNAVAHQHTVELMRKAYRDGFEDGANRASQFHRHHIETTRTD
jgi:hypothetical protein